jgi:YNFM family putative membrane transporter
MRDDAGSKKARACQIMIGDKLPAEITAAEQALQETAGLLRRGTPAFRRTNLSLFAAGFATFALVYCVQPLLPVFSQSFGVGAAESSLALSLTTLTLAVAMLVAGAVSEAWSRKGVMTASILLSASLTVLSSLMPSWHGFLLVRALIGLAVSGLPAIAMAYLSEEVHADSVGLAVGLYVGGNGFGGMLGRFLIGMLTDLFGWRVAMFLMGSTGLLAGLYFWHALPSSRHFHARRIRLARIWVNFMRLLRDPVLLWLNMVGFLLLGSFVTVYNYIGYRLLAPPFSLSQSAVGLIFSVYLVGVFSSAWMGNLASRLGRGRVLWVSFVLTLVGNLLTLASPVWLIVLGVALLTFGFFGGHSVASAWVGGRARRNKAQASSLYLCSYYLGGSVVGSVSGIGWDHFGWPGVVGLDCALTVMALAIAVRLNILSLPSGKG